MMVNYDKNPFFDFKTRAGKHDARGVPFSTRQHPKQIANIFKSGYTLKVIGDGVGF